MPSAESRHDPLVSFRFLLRIEGLPEMGFSECSGLQLDTSFEDYAEGGLNTHVHRLPGRTTQSNVTLKRGIVNREMWNWYADVVRGMVQYRLVTVVILSADAVNDEATWDLKQAFPCKWIGPELNASQSQVAVETLELCHRGFLSHY